MKHLLETTLLGLIVHSMTIVGLHAALGDEPSKGASKRSQIPPGLATLVQSITDTVLEHHIDPPARQQMILTGIKSLYKASGTPVPEGLGRRVSSVTTTEQIATLLEEVWPVSTSQSVTVKELEEELLNGLLSGVSGDAHLVPEKDRKAQEQNDGNRYVGIHIALGMDEKEKRPKMSEIIDGGPADRAGVKRGDVIEQIDGVDTKGMTLRDAVDRLRGEEGTNVTIKVRQENAAESRTYNIMRGRHPRQSIKGWHKQATGNWDFRMSGSEPIAYLQISEMVGSTPHELRKLAQRLESEGIKAVVLDLRGLWTSSDHAALLLADCLLDHGPIGRVRTSRGEMTYQADPDALFRGWPLVVLVDGNTAGASEWLAAALQDNRRAIVVGTPTLSARVDPGRAVGLGRAVVTSLLQVGNSKWSISLTTGILERGDGSPVSAFDRSSPTMIREPTAKATGVHPDHFVAASAGGQTAIGSIMKPRQRVQGIPAPAEKKALELLRQSLKKT